MIKAIKLTLFPFINLQLLEIISLVFVSGLSIKINVFGDLTGGRLLTKCPLMRTKNFDPSLARSLYCTRVDTLGISPKIK